MYQDPPQEKIHSVIKLFANSKKQEAIDEVNALIKDYPKSSLLLNLVGTFYKSIKMPDKAIQSFENAITIKPDYAEAYNNLGATLQELGRLDMAVKNYEEALSIKPDYAEAYNNLGNICRENGQQDMAFKNYEKALTIKPDYAMAHYNFGIALKESGQRDTAVKSLEKALAIQPNYVKAHHSLSSIKKFTKNDSQITLMQSLLSNSDLSQSERIQLCFALAKANENLGNQEELFEFLHEGNRLRKEDLNYSHDKSQDLSSTVRELFSPPPSDIEKSLSYEPSTIRPIFIVGMPRSGTTLVEQIISSHHEVYGAGELTTLPKIIGPIARDCLKHNTNLSDTHFVSIRKQYLEALKYCYLDGKDVDSRAGKVRKVFGHQIRFNLNKGLSIECCQLNVIINQLFPFMGG